MTFTTENTNKRMTTRSFGQLSNGAEAQLFTLTNSHGTQISISNYGGIIVALSVIDQHGGFDDVVLGYDNVADYEQDTYYLGAIIGRYAGRIKHGKITLNNQEHQLTLNAPDSQLHGGKQALNKQLWQASIQETNTSVTLLLEYTSPDGEEGYPGTVNFKVHYTLSDENELTVEYFADTDKPTIINLTQHSYFNLAGHTYGCINDHQLTLNADSYLPMSETVYPTGEIKSVIGGAHNFLQSKRIGDDINGNDQQVLIGKGYDNYWLLNASAINQQAFSAQVVEPNSGRRMTIYTDQPSMILYTANYIDGSQVGKNKVCYQARSAFCLEPVRAVTKEYINDLTPVTLLPEQPFYGKTRYLFDTVIP